MVVAVPALAVVVPLAVRVVVPARRDAPRRVEHALGDGQLDGVRAGEQPLERLGVLAEHLVGALAVKERRVGVAHLPADLGEHEGMVLGDVDDQALRGQEAHRDDGLLAACSGACDRGAAVCAAAALALHDPEHVAIGEPAREHPVAQADADLAALLARLSVQLLERLVPVDVDVVDIEIPQASGEPVIAQVAQNLATEHRRPPKTGYRAA